jgi:PTS hybrid protein
MNSNGDALVAADGYVGLVLVSHSARLVEGLADLVSQVSGSHVSIAPVGGASDGSLGTDGGRVLECLRQAATGPGAVVLMDLGSSVLAVRAALAELSDDERSRLIVADAPIVEGAIAAGVTASKGCDLAGVAQAAEEARRALNL